MEKNFERLGTEKLNNQGCLMKVVEYNNCNDIIIEFQDKYKARIHTSWHWFLTGGVKNPYHPSVFNVGIIGTKYPITTKGKIIKEYNIWHSMLQRCYDAKSKENLLAYQDAICCEEWLLYENFYEWLHNQPNFDKWYDGKRWAVDKDILIKGNKTYSPETCCLVPMNVNNLFTKRSNKIGDLPIGITKNRNLFSAVCVSPFTRRGEYIGSYETPEKAFYLGYKPYKENIIKQVAQIEYDNGNITEKCYNAMMNYIVEITD